MEKSQILNEHLVTVEFMKYGIFGFILLALLIMHVVKWQFIQDALSDKKEPSSKRLGGYILILCIASCELFSTIVGTSSLQYSHLVAILIIICLCWSIASTDQVISAIKGVPGNAMGNGVNGGDNTKKEEVKSEEAVV
jgi:uncharacterized membrane protein